MDFGQRIKTIRDEQNLTQEQMAQRLGVTRQAISNWENNRNLPDIEMLVLINAEFDLSLDYLILGGRNNMDNMAEKLIKDASDTRRLKLNSRFIIAGAFALVLGLMCLVVKAASVEYIDAAGVLHENFFLLPIGFLFLFCGFIAFLVAGINSIVGVVKQDELKSKWLVMAVGSFIVVGLGAALFALIVLANSGALS